jgi:hypothetical protein
LPRTARLSSADFLAKDGTEQERRPREHAARTRKYHTRVSACTRDGCVSATGVSRRRVCLGDGRVSATGVSRRRRVSATGVSRRIVFNLTKNWRRHPDLNWGIKVLQTSALPLGYAARTYRRIPRIRNRLNEVFQRLRTEPVCAITNLDLRGDFRL